MSDLVEGNILEVVEIISGSETVTDVLTGATSIPLDDAYDFDEKGGMALAYFNGDDTDPIFGYTGYDDETSTLLIDQSPILDPEGNPAVDGDGNPISPPPPLAFDIPAETPIYIYPFSTEKRAWVQTKNEEGDEPISVRVPHAMSAVLAVGIRTDATGYESVGIEQDQSDWVIADIIGEPAIITADAIDPDTLPIPDASDGLPPSSSPVPTLTVESIGALRWRVVPVANADQSYFRIYAAANPIVPEDPDHLVYDGLETTQLFRQINGVPLIPEGSNSSGAIPEYYVKAVQYDKDGAAPASTESLPATPRRAAQEEISANYVYAGDIEAAQIKSGQVESDLIIGRSIRSAPFGVAATVHDSTGFYADDGAGNRTVDIPNTGDPTFRGSLEASYAVLKTGMELRGTSFFAPNSTVRMGATLGNPTTPPSVIQTRPSIPLDPAAFKPASSSISNATTPEYTSPPFWDAAAGRWKMMCLWRRNADQTQGHLRALASYDSVGAIDLATCIDPNVNFTGVNGIRSFFEMAGKLWAVVTAVAGNAPGLYMYNKTTFALEQNMSYGAATPFGTVNLASAVIDTDGTDFWIAKVAQTTATGQDGFAASITAGQVYAYRQAITVVGSTFTVGAINKRVRVLQTLTDTTGGGSPKISSISASRTAGAAAFDYPASTGNIYLNVSARFGSEFGYSITHTSYTVPSGAAVDAVLSTSWYGEAYGLAFNSTDGFFWGSSGTRLFRASHRLTAGTTHSFFYTWSDDDATGGRHESLISPAASAYLFPRNEIYIQSAAVPVPFDYPTTPATSDDPTGVRFYARSTATSSLTRTWRLGTGNGHVGGTFGLSVMSPDISTQLPANADAPAYSVDTGLTRAPTTANITTLFSASSLSTPFKLTSEGDAGTRGILEIKGDGFASIPGLQQPLYWRAQSSASSVADNLTEVIVGFGTLVIGEGGWTYSSGVWTCSVAGTYMVVGQIFWNNHSAGTRRTLLRKNGTTFAAQSTGGGANNMYLQATGIQRFAAGDTFGMFGYQNSGGTLSTLGDVNTFVQLQRIAA